MPKNPDFEHQLDAFLERIVVNWDGCGLPRDSLANAMITAGAGLLIEAHGHVGASARLRQYAASVSQLSVEGNA